MDGNDWRAPQGQVQIPGQVNGVEVNSAAGMDGGDWRTQLQADSRHRIVNKIMETLKRHLPFSGPEGLQELKKIALRFEEKIYSAATSQSDYLRKISLKMLTMETKSQNPMANPLQSNAASNSQNPQDQAPQSILSQIQNQVPQQPIPLGSNQSQVRQQPLPQKMQNNISQSSASAMQALGGMSQNTMPSVPGQNSNLHNIQNITGVAQNAASGSSMGLGAPQQRQIQGRQQQIVPQDQQQQSQNSQQYLYNQQQIQQHLMKQKLQQGNVSQSMMQSQMQQQQQAQQQQNLLQPNQLQSSQQALMQPSLRQMPTPSTLQPSQQPSLQQSTQSMLQQQSQAVRQQQQLQPHQQGSMPQHPMMSLQQQQQQQQQLLGQQPNPTNMQQNQLIGQPNSVLDAQQQQQRVIAQQNISGVQQQQTMHQQNALQNVHQQQSSVQQNNQSSNMHQQQLGAQTNLSSFQPQQMGGIQHGNSTLQPNQQPVHTLQQSKVSLQQQTQPNMGNLLPKQSQQSQSQPTQQQMVSQIQSQPGQIQHQLGLQHQGNLLQRDVQQRIQTSGPLLQQQIPIDQQKQLSQPQRVVPDPSANPSTQTGNAGGGDWQEDVYQKIKSMYDMYFPELNDLYQRMASKLQQHDALPQQPKNEHLEKLRMYKTMLERLMMFLRTSKTEVLPSHREKIPSFEKQIINVINNNRPRKPPGQFGHPQMQAMQQSQQQQHQVSQVHNEGQMNSQMQPMNMHGSAIGTQQNNLTSLQQNSMSSGTGVLNSRKTMVDASQTASSADPGQGHVVNQMQQAAMSSLQQNPLSTQQHMNSNSMSSQTGLNPVQPNVYPLQANSNVLQPQQIKQEQQIFSAQQVKQRQLMLQRQQLMQQQQQATQQQSTQFPQQQIMQQLNQINDVNDVKMRHQMSGKPGLLQQHPSSAQRSLYQQAMKSGSPYSMSSQSVLQAASPQIGHHPSPQIEQQYPLATHKTGTPLQSSNSPFIAPSPSTSMAPSPVPGDSEKINHGMSALSHVGNVVNHSTVTATVPSQSLAIGTPGISTSPLLEEFTSTDGTHAAASTVLSGNSSALEQPLQRLIKAVKSMSPKALSDSVNDISSVVSMVDRIAGSAPGNGSRAAVGEDLVAMTKCRLQARNFFTQDGPGSNKKMRRYTSAVPSNVVSSTGSVTDNLRHHSGNESDGESTGASSSIKRPRVEVNHALEEELREINQRLIDTVVYISEDDVDPTTAAAAAEGGGGIIVKCSYSAVALSPNLKAQYASAQMSPIQPLRLLIPDSYPNCSPILLDNFPVEVSKEYEDLSLKAKAKFSISLRALEQPMSLADIARTWDRCARAVISEYAQQSGGGTFSSKYGTWENCLSAA